MPTRINYWMGDTHIACVPDVGSCIPNTPCQFNAFVCVPESAGPSAGEVENSSRVVTKQVSPTWNTRLGSSAVRFFRRGIQRVGS